MVACQASKHTKCIKHTKHTRMPACHLADSAPITPSPANLLPNKLVPQVSSNMPRYLSKSCSFVLFPIVLVTPLIKIPES